MIKEEKQKAIGRRGKYAEGKVQDFLKAFGEKRAAFDWGRIPDARSAGGRFPSQPGDFQFFRLKGPLALSGLAEVKEISHPSRLPAKNFDKTQIARLRLRQMAGGVIVVLVCHMPEKVWRRVPLEFFLERLSQPSWDLAEFQIHPSVAEALVNVPLFS